MYYVERFLLEIVEIYKICQEIIDNILNSYGRYYVTKSDKYFLYMGRKMFY